ncbi:MAG: sensor domain-containing diguanylate cyclase [Planctomycetes bacterium]|nr:sensor domain-containing diguanylate cyclase [Planctomycetota bacterium]
MIRVSRRSTKEELWSEVERLRQARDEAQTAAALDAASVARLEAEVRQLTDRADFADERSREARGAQEKLEILAALTKELASCDLEALLEVCGQRIPYLVGARCASVYRLERDADGRPAELRLAYRTHDRELDEVVAVGEGSLMSIAVRERRLLLIDDLGHYQAEDGEAPPRPHSKQYKTPSCVVAPLLAAGEVEGVLNLADRFDEQTFDRRQRTLIRHASELLAVAFRHDRLFGAVEAAAKTDRLTGLLNRDAFTEVLDLEVKRAARYEHPLALLTCSLSGVRLVNANYGLAAGDQLLAAIGRILRGNIRDVDLVGRVAGAEFGLILPEQHLPGASVVARRLLTLVSEARIELHGPAGERVTVSPECSFGVAEFAGEAGAGELLQSAFRIAEEARSEGHLLGPAAARAPGPDSA